MPSHRVERYMQFVRERTRQHVHCESSTQYYGQMLLRIDEQILRPLRANEFADFSERCDAGCRYCVPDLYSTGGNLLGAWWAPARSTLPCFMGKELDFCPAWHNIVGYKGYVPPGIKGTQGIPLTRYSGLCAFNAALAAATTELQFSHVVVHHSAFDSTAAAFDRLRKPGGPYPYDYQVLRVNAKACDLELIPIYTSDLWAYPGRRLHEPFHDYTCKEGTFQVAALLLRVPSDGERWKTSRWISILPISTIDVGSISVSSASLLSCSLYVRPFLLTATETADLLRACIGHAFDESNINDDMWGCFALAQKLNAPQG